MCAAVTADRGFTWSDEETALLLQLWGGNDAQSELTGNKRNFVVYEKISETMNNLGFFRTASQCREKIKRMKREYTLTKQHNEKSSGIKKSMRFFEQFEKILLEKQNRNQKNTTLKSCPSSNGIESEVDEPESCKKTNWSVRNDRKLRKLAPKNEQVIPRKLHEPLEKELDNPWTPDVVLVEETPSTSILFENQSSASTSSVNGDHSKRKKRKMNSRLSLFKCMMDSLTLKFMKYQTESDVKILSKIEELENEQTAVDERIQKMWLEFEEKRLADEREHELKVMSTFQDIISQHKMKNSSK